MTIKKLSVTSATTLDFEVTPDAPVCVLCGRFSDTALDLAREILGDFCAISSPDRYDDGRFVIHGEIAMDGKEYNICYIRNADFIGDNRIAVNFKPLSIEFSLDDTAEYMDKVQTANLDSDNVFYKSRGGNKNLPESKRVLRDFEKWLDDCVYCSADPRPLFIYDAFDYFDESVDIKEILDALAGINRQVFISVGKNYPTNKLAHKYVTAVFVDTRKNIDGIYTEIICPVCGCKTLDNYYICKSCGWEYDGFPKDHYSAANGATLENYRKNIIGR